MHIEVYERSGLSQRSYCRTHRLTETTFTRWLRAIADVEVAKIRIRAGFRARRASQQRKGRPFKLSED